MAIAKLANKQVGDTVYISENSEEVPYIILSHDYKAGSTLLLRQTCCDLEIDLGLVNLGGPEDPGQMGKGNYFNSCYAYSYMNEWLHGDFKSKLPTKIINSINEIEYQFNVMEDFYKFEVFSLSVDEINRYLKTSEERKGSKEWLARDYYIYINGSAYEYRVTTIDTDGNKKYYTINSMRPTAIVGLRPAFCLDSSISVNEDGQVGVITISGNDEDRGVCTEPFTSSFSIYDGVSAHPVTYTVTESLVYAKGTHLLRSYSAKSGENITTADFSSKWLELYGNCTLVIEVRDSILNQTMTRKIHFFRDASRIAASRSIETDRPVSKCIFLLTPRERPAGSELTFEVCNNPFDPAPVWEDMSAAVNTAVHEFVNTNVVKPGLAYRFIITAGEDTTYLERVTVKYL